MIVLLATCLTSCLTACPLVCLPPCLSTPLRACLSARLHSPLAAACVSDYLYECLHLIPCPPPTLSNSHHIPSPVCLVYLSTHTCFPVFLLQPFSCLIFSLSVWLCTYHSDFLLASVFDFLAVCMAAFPSAGIIFLYLPFFPAFPSVYRPLNFLAYLTQLSNPYTCLGIPVYSCLTVYPSIYLSD